MRYFLFLFILILISGFDDKSTAENNVLEHKDDITEQQLIEKCFSVANKELIDNPLNNFDIDKHKLNFSVQDDCYIVYYEPIYPARLGGGCKVYINKKDFSVIKVLRGK